jgi:hypothetical protein
VRLRGLALVRVRDRPASKHPAVALFIGLAVWRCSELLVDECRQQLWLIAVQGRGGDEPASLLLTAQPRGGERGDRPGKRSAPRLVARRIHEPDGAIEHTVRSRVRSQNASAAGRLARHTSTASSWTPRRPWNADIPGMLRNWHHGVSVATPPQAEPFRFDRPAIPHRPF